MSGDPAARPIPPGPMPVRHAGVWRKRWRYASAFGPELMICAGSVQVGAMGQSFWAILDRESGELLERTRMRMPRSRGEVWSEGSGGEPWVLGSSEPAVRTRISSGEVRAELEIGPGIWAGAVCPAGDSYVWTRKRVAPVEVDVQLPGGRRIRTSVRGVEDESAGYHPRHTVWSWSAGVGVAADGREVGWNLVEGVNDPPSGSERAIWIDGEAAPTEPGPVRFRGLEAIEFEDGSVLEFRAEAERAKRENKLVVRYSYRQPFGTFSGRLAGIELAEGIGVMEHHDAIW